ncbi:MAG: hypothetical protein ACF8QF_09520 [Phycisphaerales bacterium]
MNEAHTAAARAVSRLESADDGVALLMNPRRRNAIARGLTGAIVGAIAMAVGHNAELVAEAIDATLARIPGRELAAAYRNAGGAALVADSGPILASLGLGALALALWFVARPAPDTPRRPALVSPRRMLRLAAIPVAIGAGAGAYAAVVRFFDVLPNPYGAVYTAQWSPVALISTITGVATLPAYLSAILFTRALARAAGALRTDRWIARALWLIPVLAFGAPAAVWLILTAFDGDWFGLGATLGAEAFSFTQGVLVVVLLVALRRAVTRHTPEAPPDHAAAQPDPRCPRCDYRLDPARPTDRCPECGGDPARLRQSPPWARLARRATGVVMLAGVTQLVFWIILSVEWASAYPFWDDDPIWALVSLVPQAFALLACLGWWGVASRAAPANLDARERHLRAAARAGIVCRAIAIPLSAVTLVLFTLQMSNAWVLLQVGAYLAAIGAALWWWPAAGHTLRAALDMQASAAARTALRAFWLLPALAWSFGGAQAIVYDNDLWSAVVGSVQAITTEQEFYDGANVVSFQTHATAWAWVTAYFTAACAIACAVGYLHYLFTLHIAFRRAERRAAATQQPPPNHPHEPTTTRARDSEAAE